MKNPLRLPLCIAAALAVLASGCIEFEQQTATFQHDPKAVTQRISKSKKPLRVVAQPLMDIAKSFLGIDEPSFAPEIDF